MCQNIADDYTQLSDVFIFLAEFNNNAVMS